MNRFTVPAKRSFNEDISVVLIHTEKQRGKNLAMKKINGEVLLDSQLTVIKSVFGDGADIVLVIGHDSNSVHNYIYRKVRLVENEKFEETDYARSVLLGIRATTSQSVFVVDGSSMFDKKIFIPHTGSYILVEELGEAGAVVQDGNCIHFSYGVDPKLGKLIYLCEADVRRYVNCYDDNSIFHEILNKVLESGGTIAAINQV
jgi:hypothetical protein